MYILWGPREGGGYNIPRVMRDCEALLEYFLLAAAALSVRANTQKETAAMDKKKIAFIVITAISVAASLVACALGIPYAPVDVGYDYVQPDAAETDAEECADEAAAAAHAVTSRGVSAETGTD